MLLPLAPSEQAPNRSQLDPCGVYTGTVQSTDLTNCTMEVAVDELGGAVFSGCIYGPPFFAKLLGLTVKYIPQAGTRVKLTGGTRPVVFSLIPDIPAGRMTGGSLVTAAGMSSDGLPLADAVDGNASGRNVPFPEDQMAGELSMTNAMGVGVDFLATIARLRAGDLAMVETSLLDGMVRILSQHYRNFNAFGRFEIFRKGNGIDVVWQGSHEERDRWEKSTKEEPRGTSTETKAAQPSENLREEGRMRFTALMGHMGGFLNAFLHDPIKTLATANPYTNNHPSGRFRANVTDRGGLLVQSTDEIVLERVVCIPVPVRRRDATDPSGTPADVLDKLKMSAENVWRMPEGVNPYQSVFQIRQQARWLSSYHSVAKLWALSQYTGDSNVRDWHLPSETSTALPAAGGGRPELAEQDVEYIQTYATIRIMRDGSILTMAADGSAIVQGNGDVSIYAPKNYNVFAGGSVSVVAGQDINFRGRRSVEASSDVGPVVVRGAAGLRLFSDKGAVHLRGVAPVNRTTKLGSDSDDLPPDSVLAGEGASLRDYGVIICAEKGGLRLEGEGRSDVRFNGHLSVSGTGADAKFTKDLAVTAGGYLVLKTAKDFVTACRNWLGNATSGLVRLTSGTVLRNEVLHTLQVNARRVCSPDVSTTSGRVGALDLDAVSMRQLSWGHEDAAETSRDSWAPPTNETTPAEGNMVDTPGALLTWLPGAVPVLATASLPQFAHKNRGAASSLFQPLTAQMRDVSLDNTKLSDWMLVSSGQLAFRACGPNKTPYPGTGATWMASQDTAPRLDAKGVLVRTPDSAGWLGVPMKEAAPVFYYVKAEHLDIPGKDLLKPL